MDHSLSGSSVHGILQARYRSELPFPPLGDLLDPGIEPGSPALQADLIEKSLFILESQVNKKGRRGGREEKREEERSKSNKEQERYNDR